MGGCSMGQWASASRISTSTFGRPGPSGSCRAVRRGAVAMRVSPNRSSRARSAALPSRVTMSNRSSFRKRARSANVAKTTSRRKSPLGGVGNTIRSRASCISPRTSVWRTGRRAHRRSHSRSHCVLEANRSIWASSTSGGMGRERRVSESKIAPASAETRHASGQGEESMPQAHRMNGAVAHATSQNIPGMVVGSSHAASPKRSSRNARRARISSSALARRKEPSRGDRGAPARK